MEQKVFLINCLPLRQRSLFQYSTTRLRCCCSASNSFQTQRLNCYQQIKGGGKIYIDHSTAADLIRNIVNRCQDTSQKRENSNVEPTPSLMSRKKRRIEREQSQRCNNRIPLDTIVTSRLSCVLGIH